MIVCEAPSSIAPHQCLAGDLSFYLAVGLFTNTRYFHIGHYASSILDIMLLRWGDPCLIYFRIIWQNALHVMGLSKYLVNENVVCPNTEGRIHYGSHYLRWEWCGRVDVCLRSCSSHRTGLSLGWQEEPARNSPRVTSFLKWEYIEIGMNGLAFL